MKKMQLFSKQGMSLTEKQREFCWFYVVEDFGYGVRAYGKAYKIDISTPKGNQVARSAASRLLTNPKVSRYYWTLRDLKGC